jgi:hypothetical protein
MKWKSIDIEITPLGGGGRILCFLTVAKIRVIKFFH